MNAERLTGFIDLVPAFDRDGRLIREEGRIRMVPRVATLDGRYYGFHPGEIRTVGIRDLAPGQVVRFEEEQRGRSRFAVDIERIPTRVTKRYRETESAFRSSNGQSGWLPAGVRFYNREKAYGFAELDGGEEVFFHINAFIRHTHKDQAGGFQEGDEIYVKLGVRPSPDKARSVTEFICFHEDQG